MWVLFPVSPLALVGTVYNESSTPLTCGRPETIPFRKGHAQATHFACSHPGRHPLSRRRRPKDCIDERKEDAGVGGDGNLSAATRRTAHTDQLGLLFVYGNFQEDDGGANGGELSAHFSGRARSHRRKSYARSQTAAVGSRSVGCHSGSSSPCAGQRPTTIRRQHLRRTNKGEGADKHGPSLLS